MNHQMILARYSVKDILRLSSKHMTQLQLPIHWSAYLTDGDEDLNLRCTARRMPHSQLNAIHDCIPGAKLRLVRYRWHLRQALAAAKVAEPCTARRGNSEGLKTWWRLLPPSLPSHKAHSDIHTADGVRIGGSVRRGCKTIPTVIR